MDALTVYFFSLMDFDMENKTTTMHTGLAADHTPDAIRADLLRSFRDPRHISVVEVPELQPVFDGAGGVVGFIGRSDAPKKPRDFLDKTLHLPAANYPQPDGKPVDNMEDADHAPQV